VVTAGSAEEALDRLRDELPDVLVSDVGMPDEDGYALIARVRRLPKEKGGPTEFLLVMARAAGRAPGTDGH
jgi:CheY-like chemotaxis protein